MTHDREVVRDEQKRQAEPGLEVLQQVDDLGLDRHVERRHGLVGDDEFRIDRQGPRDADALALAARKLMGVTVCKIGLQPDHREQLADARRGLRSRGQPVDLQRFADDVADRHARVERGVRVLEDDLHLFAQRTQRGPAQAGDVAPIERDAAGRRVGQAQDHAAGGRLARARLADETQRFAAADVEVDAVDGLYVADVLLQEAGRDRKVLRQVADLDQTLAAQETASSVVFGAFSHASVRTPSARSS
jgi:hypothetical protein